MVKYSKKAQKYVEKEIQAHKHQGKWKNREQAVAVGLSEAREKGLKVPHKS